MDVGQIRAWLSYLGESDVQEGAEWVKTHCPLAPWNHARGEDRTPSFGLRIEPGESFTHCFACNYSGTQTELLHSLRAAAGRTHALDILSAMRMIVDVMDGSDHLEVHWAERREQGELYPFPETWLATFARAFDEGRGWVHPYLVGRGMPLAVAKRLDLRMIMRERRVAFPVREWGGTLVGLHGRGVDAEVQPTYRMITYQGKKNPVVWLGEHLLDTTRPVVLVESVFDLARVLQVYRNAACALTASISGEKIERLRRLEHVVVMFDPDRAGEQARRKLVSALRGDMVVEVVSIENDRDPGDHSAHQMAELLDGIVDLDPVLL